MTIFYSKINLKIISQLLLVYPVAIALLVLIVLKVLNYNKNKNYSYLNVSLKVLGCYYSVILANLVSLIIIQLVYSNKLIFKEVDSGSFKSINIHFISTFFLLFIYLISNLIVYLLIKFTNFKKQYISVYEILNPTSYFIFVLFFILLNFYILNSPESDAKNKISTSIKIEQKK